ncbi:MAG: right-handed parallel beta-helix repeat-containing protein [Alphaproteobacteria bacterium]|nr:right-handed parallel beta-helix repeat-containing protein [Alphaproteobacteria bacterium]
MLHGIPAGLACGLAIWLIATAASARDFHVVPQDQGSTDTATGAPDSPYPSVRAAMRSGLLSGGDRVILRDGAYGVIEIANAAFDPPVQIMAETPGRAQADGIIVRGGRGLRFSGLSVWPRGPNTRPRNIVSTDKTAADVGFDAMDIRGAPDAPDRYMRWTLDDWLTSWRANGVRLDGPDNMITNSRITGVAIGITATGDRARVLGNRIEGFSGDGMRGLGDGSVFAGNRVENSFKVDDNHDDGFQSWATKTDGNGRKTVRDLVIENNTIIEWTGPANHPLRGRLQGIGLFDGIYRNFTIRNNLIIINAYHGIALYAGADSVIANNTVVNISGGPGSSPWILLRDPVTGRGAGDIQVFNNVAMSYKGVPDALQRNAAVRFPALYFRDPVRLDFHPKPGGALVDAGRTIGAPDRDITGRSRAGRPDLGAFEAE